MDRVPDMGLHRDLLERVSLVRVDDVDRRNRLNTARKAIYEKNNTVDGVAVENLLKEDSLLPAAVSVDIYEYSTDVEATCLRMHSLIGCHRSGLTCSVCWW